MSLAKSCPKCGARMEQGFLLQTNKHGTHDSANWIEGPPSKSWMGLRLKGRRRLPVQTFRCGRCSFLESYAAEV